MIERLRTKGVFSLDGQDFEVENNLYLVGDEQEVLVVDAAHDPAAILEAVGGRRVVGVVGTHGHNDHINAAEAVAKATGAPILLHPADEMLWRAVYPNRGFDRVLHDGDKLAAGQIRLRVLHTPGHTPGGCCLLESTNEWVLSGDTLFHGGPGATGRAYSDFPTIIASIRDRLLVLSGGTRVLPGHGEETTIGQEAPHLDEWIARGY